MIAPLGRRGDVGAGGQSGHAEGSADPGEPARHLLRHHTTTLTWNANPETNLAGYEVVMQETTAPDWISAISVGSVTTVTLDISKGNVQFGLRAVDQAGHRSPVALPQVAA